MADATLKEKVQESLDKIRPRLQMDGGDVRLVDVQDGIVKVELEGACKGCPMSQITLQMGIEQTLKNDIPEVIRVEAVNSNISPEMMEMMKKFQK